MGVEEVLKIPEGAYCAVERAGGDGGGGGGGGGVEAEQDWFFEAVEDEESARSWVDADDCEFEGVCAHIHGGERVVVDGCRGGHRN